MWLIVLQQKVGRRKIWHAPKWVMGQWPIMPWPRPMWFIQNSECDPSTLCLLRCWQPANNNTTWSQLGHWCLTSRSRLTWRALIGRRPNSRTVNASFPDSESNWRISELPTLSPARPRYAATEYQASQWLLRLPTETGEIYLRSEYRETVMQYTG